MITTDLINELKRLRDIVDKSGLETLNADKQIASIIYNYFIDNYLDKVEWEFDFAYKTFELSTTEICFANDGFFDVVFGDNEYFEYTLDNKHIQFSCDDDEYYTSIQFWDYRDAIQLIKDKSVKLVAESIDYLDDEIAQSEERIEAIKYIKEQLKYDA